MRQCRLGLLLLALLAPGTLRAQEDQKVHLTTSLSEDGENQPIVRTLALLDDSRWLSMLASGFPIRLHYRVEQWRSRGGWFDGFERQVEWDVLLQHEPLLEQYTIVTLTGRGRRESRLASLQALRAATATPFRIAISPSGEGEYYYTVTLQISTLSDSDMEELERFLRGELAPAAGGTEDLGGAVGRGARRLLLRLAGLPSVRLEARTPKFRVGGG